MGTHTGSYTHNANIVNQSYLLAVAEWLVAILHGRIARKVDGSSVGLVGHEEGRDGVTRTTSVEVL